MVAGRSSIHSPQRAGASFKSKWRIGSVRPPWSQDFWRGRREPSAVVRAAGNDLSEGAAGRGWGAGHFGRLANGDKGGPPDVADSPAGGGVSKGACGGVWTRGVVVHGARDEGGASA